MKMLKYITISILLLGMCGCAMTRRLTIVLEGDKIKVPFGSYIPVEGDNIKITVTKETIISSGQSQEKAQDKD